MLRPNLFAISCLVAGLILRCPDLKDHIGCSMGYPLWIYLVFCSKLHFSFFSEIAAYISIVIWVISKLSLLRCLWICVKTDSHFKKHKIIHLSFSSRLCLGIVAYGKGLVIFSKYTHAYNCQRDFIGNTPCFVCTAQ